MKYLTSFLLLLAAATAAPLKSMHDEDLSDHTPAAAAFKQTFRTFIGHTDADVTKFMIKAQRTTDSFILAAATWKRNAQEASEEASAAIAKGRESLRLSREGLRDEGVARDLRDAELAVVRETRAKRELYFAERDMRRRLKFFEREVRLRDKFLGDGKDKKR